MKGIKKFLVGVSNKKFLATIVSILFVLNVASPAFATDNRIGNTQGIQEEYQGEQESEQDRQEVQKTTENATPSTTEGYDREGIFKGNNGNYYTLVTIGNEKFAVELDSKTGEGYAKGTIKNKIYFNSDNISPADYMLTVGNSNYRVISNSNVVKPNQYEANENKKWTYKEEYTNANITDYEQPAPEIDDSTPVEPTPAPEPEPIPTPTPTPVVKNNTANVEAATDTIEATTGIMSALFDNLASMGTDSENVLTQVDAFRGSVATFTAILGELVNKIISNEDGFAGVAEAVVNTFNTAFKIFTNKATEFLGEATDLVNKFFATHIKVEGQGKFVKTINNPDANGNPVYYALFDDGTQYFYVKVDKELENVQGKTGTVQFDNKYVKVIGQVDGFDVVGDSTANFEDLQEKQKDNSNITDSTIKMTDMTEGQINQLLISKKISLDYIAKTYKNAKITFPTGHIAGGNIGWYISAEKLLVDVDKDGNIGGLVLTKKGIDTMLDDATKEQLYKDLGINFKEKSSTDTSTDVVIQDGVAYQRIDADELNKQDILTVPAGTYYLYQSRDDGKKRYDIYQNESGNVKFAVENKSTIDNSKPNQSIIKSEENIPKEIKLGKDTIIKIIGKTADNIPITNEIPKQIGSSIDFNNAAELLNFSFDEKDMTEGQINQLLISKKISLDYIMHTYKNAKINFPTGHIAGGNIGLYITAEKLLVDVDKDGNIGGLVLTKKGIDTMLDDATKEQLYKDLGINPNVKTEEKKKEEVSVWTSFGIGAAGYTYHSFPEYDSKTNSYKFISTGKNGYKLEISVPVIGGDKEAAKSKADKIGNALLWAKSEQEILETLKSANYVIKQNDKVISTVNNVKTEEKNLTVTEEFSDITINESELWNKFLKTGQSMIGYTYIESEKTLSVQDGNGNGMKIPVDSEGTADKIGKQVFNCKTQAELQNLLKGYEVTFYNYKNNKDIITKQAGYLTIETELWSKVVKNSNWLAYSYYEQNYHGNKKCLSLQNGAGLELVIPVDSEEEADKLGKQIFNCKTQAELQSLLKNYKVSFYDYNKGKDIVTKQAGSLAIFTTSSEKKKEEVSVWTSFGIGAAGYTYHSFPEYDSKTNSYKFVATGKNGYKFEISVPVIGMDKNAAKSKADKIGDLLLTAKTSSEIQEALKGANYVVKQNDKVVQTVNNVKTEKIPGYLYNKAGDLVFYNTSGGIAKTIKAADLKGLTSQQKSKLITIWTEGKCPGGDKVAAPRSSAALKEIEKRLKQYQDGNKIWACFGDRAAGYTSFDVNYDSKTKSYILKATGKNGYTIEISFPATNSKGNVTDASKKAARQLANKIGNLILDAKTQRALQEGLSNYKITVYKNKKKVAHKGGSGAVELIMD